MFFVSSTTSIPQATSLPTVYVYPETVEAQVGETFDICVVVSNVTDLYGFDIMFAWNSTILKYIDHTFTVPVDEYSSPVPPSPYAGILYSPVLFLKEDVDESGIPGAEPGTMAWFGVSSMLPATGFNGSGTAFTMTFNVTTVGSCDFTLISTGLWDSTGFPMAHTTVDGHFSSEGCWIVNVSTIPSEPIYDEVVTVVADIRPVSECDFALLSFTEDSAWHNISMSKIDDLYYGEIPGQLYDTLVQYKIFVKSIDGNWSLSIVYSYTVGDNVPPEIVSTLLVPTNPYPYWSSMEPRSCEPMEVTTVVIEPENASGVDFVILSVEENHTDWLWGTIRFNITMEFNVTLNSWVATIPGFCANTSVEIKVVAWDNAGTVAATPLSYVVKPLIIADLNGDGKVNIFDAVLLLTRYGDTED